MPPLIILLGVYGLMTLSNRRINFSRIKRMRISLSCMFLFTGFAHFFLAEGMSIMIPTSFPLRLEIICVTGILEILGALGLLIPNYSRLSAQALFLFLLAIFPANIYAAFVYADFGGHIHGPIYLLYRMPLQIFFVWWAMKSIRSPDRSRSNTQK